MAVFAASQGLGMNLDKILEVIDLYGTRNELVHASFTELLKERKWHQLSRRLHDDFVRIPLLVPAGEQDKIHLMRAILDSIIDLWFERNESDPEEYQAWRRSKTVAKLYNDLSAASTPDDEARISKEVRQQIDKSLKKRLHEAAIDRNIIESTEANLAAIRATPRKKRIASSQLSEAREANRKMKTEWKKIVNLVGRQEDVRLVCGPLRLPWTPLEIIHDTSLDE